MMRSKEDLPDTSCQRMIEEEQIRERTDEQGNKWVKVYFGGGAHLKNWVEQCKELGEVEIEEVKPQGLKCYQEGDEKLFRVWLKAQPDRQDDLYE